MNKNTTRLPGVGASAPTEADLIKGIVGEFKTMHDEVEVLGRDMDSLRRMVTHGGVGTRGDADTASIGEFCAAVAAQKLGRQAPAVKVAALMDLTNDSRGGYLTTPEVHRAVDSIMRPFGSVLSACRRVPIAAVGQEYQIPMFTLPPSADWQGGEGTELTEQDVTIGALNRRCEPVGGWNQFSWQLVHNGDFDALGAIAAEQFNANAEAAESALIAGEAGSTSPWDGLLELSGTHAQSALATPTSALLSTFLSDTFADNASLYSNGTILLAPHVAEIIAKDDSSGNYTARTVYGVGGQPELHFGRWRILTSPAVGSNVIVADLSKVWYLDGGSSVLVDDRSGSRSLIVYQTAVNWVAFGVTLPSCVSKAAITSLS